MDKKKKKKTDKNQLSEFDILTCDGFEELFALSQTRAVAMNNDTVYLLLIRLCRDYPAGTGERRNAVYRLLNCIRGGMVGELMDFSVEMNDDYG